jgi:hypothetical protein
LEINAAKHKSGVKPVRLTPDSPNQAISLQIKVMVLLVVGEFLVRVDMCGVSFFGPFSYRITFKLSLK